jgi:threonine aldolase
MTYLAEATALARRHGLGTHLDGARLFNAAVALGGDARANAKAIAGHFDSVSVCFSKGLGAPVGSALVGPKELIQRAHRWRKMLGGGMRQAGVLAAAAQHALEHHIDRLADDHALATLLAEGLSGIGALELQRPQTNILFVNVRGGRGAQLLAHLKAQGVLATGLIGLRFVTHLDVDRADIDRAIAAVRGFFKDH